MLKNGGATFFLDGYDEIAIADREAVTNDLKSLFSTFPKNSFAITSRPDIALTAFSGFLQYSIEPLKKKESYELIKKYDPEGERAAQLIEKLEKKQISGVEEFLANPLLTTLLYRCYEYKNQIPLKKPIFYRQVFDALYDWHDSAKDGYSTREKTSRLDIDNFHRVLKGLGFICVIQGKIEGSHDEVLSWIAQARQFFPDLAFPESAFLEDAIKAVPVLCRDGNYIRWSHKSLSEYFAALFIVQDLKLAQEEFLRTISQPDQIARYENVIDLIYDIDYLLFRQYFVAPLAQLFEKYAGSSFKGLDTKISIESIRRRQSIMFFIRPVIVRTGGKSNFSLLQKEIVKIAEEWGFPELSPDGTGLNLFQLRAFPNSEQESNFVLGIPHPLSATIEILRAKKDPLMVDAINLVQRKGPRRPLRGVGASKITYLTDSPNSPWNKPKYFDDITDYLLQIMGSAVDIEKLADNSTVVSKQGQIPQLVINLIKQATKANM